MISQQHNTSLESQPPEPPPPPNPPDKNLTNNYPKHLIHLTKFQNLMPTTQET